MNKYSYVITIVISYTYKNIDSVIEHHTFVFCDRDIYYSDEKNIIENAIVAAIKELQEETSFRAIAINSVGHSFNLFSQE